MAIIGVLDTSECDRRYLRSVVSLLTRVRDLAMVLLLAATVLVLIGILVLLGRWDVPKALSAVFFVVAAVLALPYVRTWI